MLSFSRIHGHKSKCLEIGSIFVWKKIPKKENCYIELHIFNLDQPSVTKRASYIGFFKKSTIRRKGKVRPVITKRTSKNLQQPLWVIFPWNCFQMQPAILYINSKYTSKKHKLNRCHIDGHLTLYPLYDPPTHSILS